MFESTWIIADRQFQDQDNSSSTKKDTEVSWVCEQCPVVDMTNYEVDPG